MSAMNLWRRLRSVFPDEPLRIARVTSIQSTAATSVLTLPDGGVIVARGTDVPVGELAYVRSGLIEGAAPALAIEEIEI